MKVQIGAFDFERFLNAPNQTLLPSFSKSSANNSVLAMDELQWVFTSSSNDLLLTLLPFSRDLQEYLKKLGFFFNTRHLVDTEEISQELYQQDIFEIAAIDQDLKAELSGKNYSLDPFCILPGTEKFNKSLDLVAHIPDFKIVQEVNSKKYSYELRSKINANNNIGCIVYSADQLLKEGDQLLLKNKFLVKDFFGVSGKGNLLVDSPVMLNALCRHLKKQEKNGKKTFFLIEPLLDKKYDFCCQFRIEKNGDLTVISTNTLLNSQFSYLGSKEMDSESKALLESKGYYSVINKIAQALFNDGYFGDVCVDSMMLADNTLMPIVEINCRKSMSLLNYHLGEKLLRDDLFGQMIGLNIKLNLNFGFNCIMEILDNSRLLLSKVGNEGVAIISCNTLEINKYSSDRNKQFYTGRIYMYLCSKNIEQLFKKLKECLLNAKIEVFD
ncbi:hypothetical protein [Agarilytica rhodophyticola]|uniref:hypothetical protein n=1 Tax=Agarilytica rhodophyticola TaxID=1737490 RepID=UPI000B34564D|nr:hypothetical protein [Agarilytica rhodophyticola]